MPDQRKPKADVSPEYEDSGLFKSMPSRWQVDLVPQFAFTSRKDMIIKGFLNSESAIEVVFAGRRCADVVPVAELLKNMWTRANMDLRPNSEPPKHDDVRLPIYVEGAWRPRFKLDTQGWQTRDHQLYAARWQVQQQNGEWAEFGEPARLLERMTRK